MVGAPESQHGKHVSVFFALRNILGNQYQTTTPHNTPHTLPLLRNFLKSELSGYHVDNLLNLLESTGDRVQTCSNIKKEHVQTLI